MTSLENQKIKDDWQAQAETLLEGHPEKLLEFKQLWNTCKFQESYMFMDEFVRHSSIKPSLEYQTADENFYWLLR
jgi:hypothetical protein